MTSEKATAILAETATQPLRPELPVISLRAPDASELWWKATMVLWVIIGALAIDRLCVLLMNYWLLQSLGFESVFWTNFWMGLKLFIAAFVAGIVMIAPVLSANLTPTVRRTLIHIGCMDAPFEAYFFSRRYLDFLMSTGKDFGYADPVFGIDTSWYVYTLPAIWSSWWLLAAAAAQTLVVSILCDYLSRSDLKPRPDMSRVEWFLGVTSSFCTRGTLAILGVIAAAGWWLARYSVLTKSNKDSSIFAGAAYVDATGFFSTVNDYWVAAVITLCVTVLLYLMMKHLHRVVHGPVGSDWRRPLRRLGLGILALLCVDFAFKAAVTVRQRLFVKPNEPVIQLPFIKEHIDATRRAYGIDKIETVRFIPKDDGDPLPKVEELLQHPTLQNASLWPGFVSYLEELVDLQHSRRVLQTNGDTMVYGPLLEIFRQQQKLRSYYNFLDVDMIRYPIDGTMRMLVSAVREVPLLEPQPWLAWWGQRFMLFTHGFGLVTAFASEVDPAGGPVYVSSGLPVQSKVPELQEQNQSVYYGEGAGSMAYSNVRSMKELDYPTDEGRAEIIYPPDVNAGVPIDSLLKRLVFGYMSGQFWEIVLSDLIGDETRVHYLRTPIERLEAVLPLFYDSDPFAVVAEGRIVWLVNGMTHTDMVPYSRPEWLGDKSDERSPFPQEHVWMNYVRDSVKATVDGYTGKLTFYKMSDESIVETMSIVYPDLFTPGERMPPAIRQQLQYPAQLLHLQFDDLYITYQMKDPMTFFNMEDMWDDGDEVLGPILDQGTAIRFSIEPFYMMLETGDGILPPAQQKTQFVQALVFTPERALNLRAIPIVYQDGPDYGRIVCLQVPKGHYSIGPEQADAAIDQEPEIAQQITWWNRRGVEVIRGHTTTLVINGEVIYVEPIFLRSQQNPVTQIKRVCVVFRGRARIGATLEEALRRAVEGAPAPGPPALAAPPAAVEGGSPG